MSKRYIIGDRPHWRAGKTYRPGEVIELPDGEKPSKTWKPYEEPAAPAPKGGAVEIKKRGTEA